jgi:hypothetical protein
MGNNFQILIIIGIVVFAVVKQLAGLNKKGKKQQRPPVTLPKDNEEWEEWDYTPPAPSYEVVKQPLPSPKTKKPKQTKKPEAPAPQPPIKEEPENAPEFDICSTEEVRRAIIWSEILNRKY